jgi:uncharacterized protein YceK
MKQTRLAAVLALAGVLLVGCGTIRNLASGDPDIYGGVQKDVAFIQTPPTRQGVGVNPATLAVLMPVDLCLSFVGDTLTLPVAICLRQNASGDGQAVTGRGNLAHPGGPGATSSFQGSPPAASQMEQRLDTTPPQAQAPAAALLSPSR